MAHPFTWECPSGRNLTKIWFKIFALRAKIRACAYGTLIISARFAWKVKGHASRGNYSKLYSKLFKFLYWGAPVAHLFWGSLFEREIIQKLGLKIIQKFLLGGAPVAHPFTWECPSGRNLTKIWFKIFALRAKIRACAYGTLIISARFAWKVKGHASRGNYSKLYSKLFKFLYWGAPVAHLFWGSLFEREIIQKLGLKIIQKFFTDCKSADRDCRIANPTELLVGVPCGQKSFKIYTKSNKIGTLRVEIIQN